MQNCLALAIKECELGERPLPPPQKKVALLPDQFTAWTAAFGSADGEPEA